MTGKLAIVGPGASGKDYLRKRFMDRNFRFGISCTTRFPRETEVEGEDYFFLSDEEFENKIKAGEFVEWQSFKGWKYGITVDEFNRCDVMILNAEAVDLLSEEYRNKLFVIYLNISEETRRSRLESRDDVNDDVNRRIKADDDQFRNFSNYDCIITNDNF